MAEDDALGYVPSDDEVIAATAQEILECRKRPFFDSIRGFRFVPGDSPDGASVWVKYGYSNNTWGLRCEAETQAYVHGEIAKLDEETRRRIYVPRVFSFIEAEFDGFTYGMIVMEYVAGVPVSRIVKALERSDDEAGKEEKVSLFKGRVIDAICFLLSLQPSPETTPGPVGGGRILNFIFGRDNPEAPREFDDVEDLQTYINEENKKVYTCPIAECEEC